MKKFFIGIAVVIVAAIISFVEITSINETQTAQAETPTIEQIVEAYVLDNFGEGYYGVLQPEVFEGDYLTSILVYDPEGEPYVASGINLDYYTNYYFG